MFILFGFTRRPRVLATRPGSCAYCGVHGPHRIIEESGKFTVFFIPLFTTSRKFYSVCTNCGGHTNMSSQQKDALLRT